MKTVNEIFAKIKGAENVDKVLAEKKRANSVDTKLLVNALVNDKTYKIDNFKTEEEVNISELIRNDIKKTLEKAKFPQKNEASVIDDAEICTEGLTKAIPYLVLEHLKTGRTFELPPQEKMKASIYLRAMPARTRQIKIRNVQNGKQIGDVTLVSKDWFQLRAKSPIPKHLQRKVFKGMDGKPLE